LSQIFLSPVLNKGIIIHFLKQSGKTPYLIALLNNNERGNDICLEDLFKK